MLEFYREKNGDYLVVETDTENYYRQNFGKHQYEGRATAIAGNVRSVSTTGIGQFYVAECRAVDPGRIPEEWLSALVGEGG